MNLIIYTKPAWVDFTLPLACSLSLQNDVYLFIEITRDDLQTTMLGVELGDLGEGVKEGLKSLTARGYLAPSIERMLSSLRGFYLVVHKSKRVYSPLSIFTALRASRIIRSFQPDLIHVDDFTGRLLPVIYSLRRIPVVASLHDVEEHPGEASRRFHTIRRWGLRRTKRMIFHSEYGYTLFKKSIQYKDIGLPGYIVPLGIPTIVQKWKTSLIPEIDRTILFWGRISAYKGLEVLCEAAPMVARRVSGVRFIIAGRSVTGYKLPLFPSLANQCEFDLRLRYIPYSETFDLFKQSSLIVLPYTSATQSGVVATAFGFWKPVIASKIGGLPEMVRDNVTGLLVAVDSAEELAAAIIDLLEHPGKRKRISENISTMVGNELEWSRLAEMVKSVYEKAIQPQS